jgi:predicted amidophosphoribosyltransferase
VRDAQPQAALPLTERAGNVRGAFAATTALRGARVAIVDDVMTTGATLRACARALVAEGCTRAVAVTFARSE